MTELADRDVETGLALRALTRTVAILAATTLVVGFIATATASMAQVENGGAGRDAVLPGLIVLGIGEFLALAATALATWSLIRVLRRKVPEPLRAVHGLSRALGLLTRALVAIVLLAVLVVGLTQGEWLSAVLGGLVACQIGVIFAVVRAQVLRVRR